MPQTITLILPDNILQPAQRVAQATKQSVEELLVAALQAALPTLEGLPPDVAQPLVALESLDDQALWRVMLETVPLDQQHQLQKHKQLDVLTHQPKHIDREFQRRSEKNRALESNHAITPHGRGHKHKHRHKHKHKH